MISRVSLPPWTRRPVVVVVLAALALAALLSGGLVVARAVDGTPAATGGTGSNGDNNVAAGVNTRDGKNVYAFKLKIVQVTGETVDATNAAGAVNSGCTDCMTVAVAFEGVVVVGSPTDFEPTNLAIAINEDCSGCTAFADAYQKVVQTSTRVRVTGEGRRRIASIRRDLDALRKSGLSLDEIRARVAADEQAFADVMSSALVPVGHVQEPAPATGADVSDEPDASGQPTTDPAPAGTSEGPSPAAASPEPSAASAAPTDAPAASSSSEPSPADSASPSAAP